MPAPESDKAGVRQVIRTLRKAGRVITAVEDGAGEVIRFAPDASENDIIADVMSCDDGALLVLLHPKGIETGFVYFVYGNDPEEVVCNYTTNLPEVDDLTNSWIGL